MKIIKTQVLRGPNVWSGYRKKLIQMRLDLEEMEDYPTNRIDGFRERLQQLLPSLIEHECSEGHRGGFFYRVELGTWMGHVIEHIALELQNLAGMQTGYGRTRSTRENGVYNVVFSYEHEEAGLYAAKAAVRLAEALIAGNPYNLETDIEALREICADNCLGPSTGNIVAEAVKRNIPWMRLGNDSLIQLGYGAHQKRFQATMTCNTSILAVDLAGNKARTKELLAAAALPVPAGSVCREREYLEETVADVGFPVVIKPLDGNQGKGATINITNMEDAYTAFDIAKEYSRRVIVEKYIEGHDFRMLVVDGKFIAAAKRMPAHVEGNGFDTINTLINEANSDSRRGVGHENVMTKIYINDDTHMMLIKQGYTLDAIPAPGTIVYLKSTANLSTGGSSEDVTNNVCEENIILAERVAAIIGLDICGIDVMAKDLSLPIAETNGAIIEVNAAPGFRMHLAPSVGEPRNVAAPVIDMLFPDGRPKRIPIIGITGTNGKTTTTRLTAHITQSCGLKTGFTTTDGIYINKKLVMEGDTTGPVSGKFVLQDPGVEFAVLETARGGILRSGLCYDECDIAIVTNINEDHLGLNDIHTLDDLARVKAVVPQTVKRDGWAILNAEDRYCRKIARDLDCNVAWFALDAENPIVKEMIEEGRVVAYPDNGFITVIKQGEAIRIASLSNVPLTQNGELPFMVANTLAASLATYLYGFTVTQIADALQTFVPGFELTPGRMNLFELRSFKVLVDYAHNPHGYNAIKNHIKNTPARRKIGIISGVGDRRDEDIRECAMIAGEMFDHVIIRQESDLRGSTADKLERLIAEGLKESNSAITYDIISNESDALKHAMDIAEEGDFITALTEDIKTVVKIIKARIEDESRHDRFVQSA
ncbi:cyanophycin synthetase [Flavobacterium album]|uniref:Cyanophycin synthetase n=1 Tax=Flavobacterium album TaxID=2175091 RepID=A0A2S1R1N1_9FLAO|nr:cyanophycin synthetase [Flavobacterium album]AWH86580.1 cyanophycin synthetase [Flavobacterium album]